jgi:hypothetical protein
MPGSLAERAVIAALHRTQPKWAGSG